MTTTEPPRLVGGRYVIDGVALPRVTSVLDVLAKPGLEKWKHKIGLKQAGMIRREAAELGTAIHAVCETVNRGGQPPMSDPKLTPYVRAYLQWFRRNVAEVVACEQLVWSSRYRYAGTLDLIARLHDGRTALVDLKSSNSLDMTYRMQTAAYVNAAAECLGLECDTRLIVQVPSKEPGAGYLTEYEQDRYSADLRAFRAALVLYRFQERHGDDWKRKGKPFGKARG